MRHVLHSPLVDARVFSRSSCPAGPSVLGLAWASAVRMLTLPRRIAAIRRDLAQLGQMSGRDLADIGLIRQDVWDAASLPFGRSPGLLFKQRAGERRRAALGQRR